MKLRIEERGHDTGFPSGAVSYTPVLLMNGEVVDAAGWNLSPYGYMLLLPPEVRYRSYRVYEAGAYDWHLNPWAIYLSPSVVDRTAFGAISDCIGSNLAAIDAAFDKATPDRRYRITSTWHVPHDSPVLTPIWKCPGGRSIRMEPPDLVSLCDAAGACLPIGRSSALGNVLQLYQPAKDFYAQCRDASDRSFYKSLQPAQQ